MGYHKGRISRTFVLPIAICIVVYKLVLIDCDHDAGDVGECLQRAGGLAEPVLRFFSFPRQLNTTVVGLQNQIPVSRSLLYWLTRKVVADIR